MFNFVNENIDLNENINEDDDVYSLNLLESENDEVIDPTTLPIYNYRDDILKAVRENPVVILQGDTGTGKTTQLPQILLNAEGCSQSRIAISQPRRIAVVTLARRVAREMQCCLGKEVGYHIRFDRRSSAASTRIEYMTDGILLTELVRDPRLLNFDVLVIDEAHERSVRSDVLLALLRTLVMPENASADHCRQGRGPLKLVVCSATISAGVFQTFFDDRARIVCMEGRPFEIDVKYLPNMPKQIHLVDITVRIVQRIHNSQIPGDILVFLMGENDIIHCCQRIHNFDPSIVIAPFYGALGLELQKKVFRPAPGEGLRKVVVATNIAETSITIPGIRYVIDCGYFKMASYDGEARVKYLTNTQISRAQSIQRKGRVGRIERGTVYRLYTERAYQHLKLEHPPEILRCDFSEMYLLLVWLHGRYPSELGFISAPPQSSLAASRVALLKLGVLAVPGDAESGLTSPRGRLAAQLPIEPHLAVALLCALERRCFVRSAVAAIMLAERYTFITPWDRVAEAREKHMEFQDGDGDMHSLLVVFCQYRNTAPVDRADWCSRNFINLYVLQKVCLGCRQLIDILSKQQILVNDSEIDWKDNLVSAFLENSFHNVCTFLKYNSDGKEIYLRNYPGKDFILSPRSFCLEQEGSPLITFAKIARGDKRFKIKRLLADEFLMLERSIITTATRLRADFLLDRFPQLWTDLNPDISFELEGCVIRKLFD